jgi:mRNA interferase MazF
VAQTHDPPRQGDVYWLDFGLATGSAPAGRRPCVVVQSDIFNLSRIRTTVVCAITSNLSRAKVPNNVALQEGEGGLSKPSVVNVSQIMTVDKMDLDERIGRLSSSAIAAVRSGIHLLVD